MLLGSHLSPCNNLDVCYQQLTARFRVQSGQSLVLAYVLQTLWVYNLIYVFVLNIQASLYKDVDCHCSENDKPDNSNHDSRWDSKCIDQHVHMRMLIKVFTFRRHMSLIILTLGRKRVN